MTRILFDQNVPVGLRRHLTEDVSTTYEEGWHELRNGDLFDAAEKAGFDIFITCDQGIRYQQNLAGRKVALVVLLTNLRNTILNNVGPVLLALTKPRPGSYQETLGMTERGRNPE
jgi:hypothetical protein